MITLAQRISASGYCSRRAAIALIKEGKVTVNGKPVDAYMLRVSADDKISVEGKKLDSIIQDTRVWIYNKPVGLITTHSDPKNRKTVFASLPKNMPRVISVGRLDINSQGLLILTNNGTFARFLELPKNKLKRTYEVRVFGNIDTDKLSDLKNGITIEKIRYDGVSARILKLGGLNSWLEVSIHEGKNREIRKILEHIGLRVNKLIRVKYGPFRLGKLETGDVMEVTEQYEDYIRKISG